MRVLIVDDSAMVRKALSRYTAKLDLEIVGMASNGFDAIEMVRKEKPDIVTLDITMPEMDGLVCLEQIMDDAPDTKVLIISALSDKFTAVKAVEMGASYYLIKPIEEEELTEAFEIITSDELYGI